VQTPRSTERRKNRQNRRATSFFRQRGRKGRNSRDQSYHLPWTPDGIKNARPYACLWSPSYKVTKGKGKKQTCAGRKRGGKIIQVIYGQPRWVVRPGRKEERHERKTSRGRKVGRKKKQGGGPKGILTVGSSPESSPRSLNEGGRDGCVGRVRLKTCRTGANYDSTGRYLEEKTLLVENIISGERCT